MRVCLLDTSIHQALITPFASADHGHLWTIYESDSSLLGNIDCAQLTVLEVCLLALTLCMKLKIPKEPRDFLPSSFIHKNVEWV